MKMAAVVLMVALGGSMAGAQGTSSTVKDDLFNGTEKFAKGASDVTEVTMDPDTLGMVSGDNSRRARGMVLNVVRTYEYDKPGMYNIADVEQIRQRLNTGDWHCSVHTQDLKHGESTDICSKHRSDGLLEQAIITVEPKELTFIHTIKRGGNGEHGGPGAGDSMLFAPEMPGLGGWGPASQARFASMGPVMAAKFAAMEPQLAAQMAAAEAQVGAAEAPARHGDRPQSRALPQPPSPPQPPAAPIVP